MSIKQKLAVSFIIMILLVIVVGSVMLYGSYLREKHYTHTVATMQLNSMVKEISFFVDQQMRSVDYYILLEEDEERRRFEEYAALIKGKFADWNEVVVDPELVEDVVDLEEIYNDTIYIAQRIIAVQRKGQRRKAIDMMERLFVSQEKQLKNRLKSLVSETTQSMRDAQEKADYIFRQQTYISTGVTLLAIVLGIILSVFIFRSIARPLNLLKKGAISVGKGNLDFRLRFDKNDEFGTLAGSFNDMAENLQKMQAQIIQLDRMSSMGQLAGGVAHELNNPLTGVLGQAQILLSRIPKDSPLRDQVIKIERAALRCRKIVRELLDFSRQKEYVFNPANIHELIENTLLLCESDLHAFQIRIIKDFSSVVEPILISSPHVQQVFLNLINNAMHAMTPGGTLAISTKVLSSGFTIKDRRKDQGDVTMPGKWLAIHFEDTGSGIDQKNISHVFDPFFTTKDVGKGTGLGLTISYGIIQNHRGSITVESKGVGMGAQFTIRLPYNRNANTTM